MKHGEALHVFVHQFYLDLPNKNHPRLYPDIAYTSEKPIVCMSERRKFSAYFKHGAVKQSCQPGVSCAQVARELGIDPNLLSRWKRETKGKGHQDFIGSGNPREDETSALKRELFRIKKERDFLRKVRRSLPGNRPKISVGSTLSR